MFLQASVFLSVHRERSTPVSGSRSFSGGRRYPASAPRSSSGRGYPSQVLGQVPCFPEPGPEQGYPQARTRTVVLQLGQDQDRGTVHATDRIRGTLLAVTQEDFLVWICFYLIAVFAFVISVAILLSTSVVPFLHERTFAYNNIMVQISLKVFACFVLCVEYFLVVEL